MGGAFVKHGGDLRWRWAFITNFPLCALRYILATLFIRLNAVSLITLAQKLKSMDWISAVLFLGMRTLTPVIVGLAGVVVFIFLALYYTSFYCMSARGSTTTRTGIKTFPALFLMVPGSIVVARLTTRVGRFRCAIWIRWAMTTLGCGLLLLLNLHTKYVVLAAALTVFGIGSGMVLTSVNVGIQAISKVENCSMAASMYGFMRSLGMPLGVKLSGSIAHDSERYIHVLRTMEIDDLKRTAILESYLHGFWCVFFVMTIFSASAL
ncbi:MFS general substrate transporter [Lindgomyces ingoldianus]|uniref:MFS general substrate transporter n=1 Tax=Lindgomyces ingoldianus TaxID=673940 RepID=A0ACB6QZA7_9PLEO|nr:MFS general substrate transporter [Lindgomyces ingoldianus]KAF2472333.1 MFS general substrate transporter [Lindgomyces ingoldianus]